MLSFWVCFNLSIEHSRRKSKATLLSSPSHRVWAWRKRGCTIWFVFRLYFAFSFLVLNFDFIPFFSFFCSSILSFQRTQFLTTTFVIDLWFHNHEELIFFFAILFLLRKKKSLIVSCVWLWYIYNFQMIHYMQQWNLHWLWRSWQMRNF